MQFLMELDINYFYQVFGKFDINLINHFFTGYEYEECTCGGSCYCCCGYNIIDKLDFFLLIFIISIIIITFILLTSNSSKSTCKSEKNLKVSDIPLA